MRFNSPATPWSAMHTGWHRAPGAATWLSELIWRDFYFQILHHHPHVVGHSFKPAYDAIQWESGPEANTLFAAWCEGRTGYPLVDAAMAQINQTGYMHNRLRMVVASLPTKALHAPWLARPLELQDAGVRLGDTYPLPVVEHDAARHRTLERYAVVKSAAA